MTTEQELEAFKKKQLKPEIKEVKKVTHQKHKQATKSIKKTKKKYDFEKINKTVIF